MQSSTISVSPLPPATTTDQVREIFHAFSVKNVHIDGQTAYVEFSDEGDLETIQIQFDNYEVPELNNAKIDKAEFDWNSIIKDNSSPDKKSDASSDKHQDLMAADLDNLIIIQDCDKMFLDGLSQENIRELFKDFHSINRIVKRRQEVIVQFTEAGQIEKLEAIFPEFNIPQLGWKCRIEKADATKITAQEFVSEWSKLHAKQSLITQPTLGYEEKERKPSNGLKSEQNKFGFDSYESKPSQASQQVLHQDIIPPFDKKTSMEVNFLNQQSKLGYKQEQKQHEPIHEATTHQQLDFSSQVNIDRDQEKLGYEAAQKKQKQEAERQAQAKRKQQQEQNQRKRKDQEQRERNRKYQEQLAQRKRQQEQQDRQRRRKEQEERQIKRKQQEEREKERLNKEKEQQQARIKYEQEARKRRQQQEADRIAAEEQTRRRRQSQALDKELKEKLYAQRLKFEKEQEQRLAKEQKHQAPTESETVAQQAQFIKEAGKTIQQQLGYAVNMAKAQSANLVNAGLQILKGQQKKIQQKLGYSTSTTQKPAQKTQSKTEELGYKKESPKETGLELLNSSFQFLKGSYNKIQQKIQTIATKGKQVSHPSEMGYEKWSVKPDINIPRPVVGQQPKTLKTLITITLLIWVIFLLMQDTGSATETVHHEVQIQIPTVEATQQSVVPQVTNL